MNPKQPTNPKQYPEWWDTSLSDAPVTEETQPNGTTIRKDALGRTLCHSKRRDGELCKSPAMQGQKVCRMHGGATTAARNNARLRLAELVDPAIATLAKEMVNAEKSSDKQAAANSVLDRAGYGRSQHIGISEAKELLYERLLALAEEGDIDAEQTD